MDVERIIDGMITLALVLLLGMLVAATIVGLLYCITVIANTTVG